MFFVVVLAALLAMPSLVRIYGSGGTVRPYREEGWITPTPRWVIWAVGVAAAVILLWLLALQLVPPTVFGAERGTASLMTVSIMLPGAAIYAVGEELLFRGYLQGLLQRRAGEIPALIASALLFTLLYVLLVLIDTQMWVLVPYQLISGLLYGELRRRSGSVWVAAIAHALAMVVTVSTLL